jgi:probable O-glycosylation ligase (exosortase A-associated)
MRDLIIAALVFGAVPFILWRPAVGIFLWVWISVMSPHRMAYGFAYDFPFAQTIAISTLIGILFSRENRRMPVTPVTVVLLLMVLWMNVTTFFAIDIKEAWPMYERVMKIQLMIFVSLFILHSKRHVQALMWVVTLSVAFFGIKGGFFTLRGGGESLVWGPEGSFIADNNHLALAVIMTIPLLYYLRNQASKRWVRLGLLGAMVLCGFSALGSYSRGALLAIAAMIGFLWSKSRSRAVTGFVLVLLIPVAIGFMPDKWMDRMRSIQTYEQDASSMGRINAWYMAINLANDRPLVGGGFEIYTPSVFARYAPNPDDLHAAHSIYFQMLGEHGYVGLMLFLLLWFLVWRDAGWIIRHTRERSDLQWALDLARMVQVSLVGYAVGGAFLSLAYYDVPFNLLVVLVLTRRLVEKELRGLAGKEEVPLAPQSSGTGQGEGEAIARAGFDPQMSADRRRVGE